MNENENEIIDSTINTDSTENEEIELYMGDDEDTSNEPQEDERVTKLQKEIETLSAQKEHWRNKAQKATPVVQENNQTPKNDSNLSTLDVLALSKSEIHEDDYDRVLSWAKDNKMQVREALKDDELKAVLAVRNEKRTVAQASHSGASRRSNFQLSEDALISNARKGILPDKESDWDKLHEATMKGTR